MVAAVSLAHAGGARAAGGPSGATGSDWAAKLRAMAQRQSEAGGPSGVPPSSSSGTELVDELRREATDLGIAAIGVAPASPMLRTRRVLEERKAAGLAAGMQFTYRNPARSTDPGRILPGARSLVVAAWPYGEPSGPAARPVRTPGRRRGRATGAGPVAPSGVVSPSGVVARYAQRDHYGAFKAALEKVAAFLRGRGWAARVVVDDNALVDRAAAVNAGVGWFGKNCNVLLPEQGSWFLLGSVVTDASLPAQAPAAEGCGACRRCLAACPTGALVAPGVLDSRRCLAWLLQAPGMFPFEFREALGARIYGCDDCQEVCPVNRTAVTGGARGGGTRPLRAEGDLPEVDVLDILSASGPELLAKYGRWYIPRRDPRYLQRNALLVLGNTGDGQAAAVAAALTRYLASPDEMLRAHAVWAAARAGRPDLLEGTPGLLEDLSPVVREELCRRHEVVPRSGRAL